MIRQKKKIGILLQGSHFQKKLEFSGYFDVAGFKRLSIDIGQIKLKKKILLTL